MCGIAYTSFEAGDLSATMRRRGPDGYLRISASLGDVHHSLLAVNGHQRQPIFNRSAATAYNGEIYNASELGARPESDASLMAEGFEAEGVDFLHLLNGDWALVQVRANEVVAVRGRFGQRPLFRFYDGEHLVYASNVATIQQALRAVRKSLCVNPKYPSRGRIPLPSRYLHLEPLPPGTMEIAKKRKGRWEFRRGRWYRPLPENHGPLEEVLSKAVQIRLHARGAVAVSGGVDSFLVREFAGESPLYHLDVTGEAAQARAMGARMCHPSTVPTWEVKAAQEQPYYALPPNFFLARAMREADPDLRVVLTGIGADEVFGGYQHHSLPFDDPTYRQVYGIERPAGCADWRSAELEHSIPHHYGYRTDQMFLWHGMEVRHPYLDHRVVETALCEGADGKEALKRLARGLGWKEQRKKGFAANLARFVAGPEQEPVAS